MTTLADHRAATTGVTPVVADAMIRFPKVCGPATTVAAARAMFRDDHVHALLIVDGPALLSVVERSDLTTAGDRVHAVHLGRLAGRTIAADADVAAARRRMDAARTRRLAVVDDRGRLLGLLCLKRSGRGFCTDTGVRSRARAAEAGR